MVPSSKVTMTALTGIKLVEPGDDLGGITVGAFIANGLVPEAGDVLVVAQKVVSKAEDRYVDVATVHPSEKAIALAAELDKDPRFVEVVLSESKRVVRHRPGLLIVEHRLGYVMANAGIDHSNVPTQDGAERVLLLPEDPDGSARVLRERFSVAAGGDVAVIVADTFGRPWREGLTNIAIGVAGFAPLKSYLGERDPAGRPLQATILALADELASAAEPVMGKLDRVPAAIVRGLPLPPDDGSGSKTLLRDPARDLFR